MRFRGRKEPQGHSFEEEDLRLEMALGVVHKVVVGGFHPVSAFE